MHNGYINVDNKKMSKSLGNFFTVRDVAEKYGYEPIRYLMVSSHYRMPINYSVEIIEQCKASLERLYNCKNNLEFAIENEHNSYSICCVEVIVHSRYEFLAVLIVSLDKCIIAVIFSNSCIFDSKFKILLTHLQRSLLRNHSKSLWNLQMFLVCFM